VRGYTFSGVCVTLLLLCWAGAPAQARGGVEAVVPVPSSGNVAVARLVIQSSATTQAQTPRLTLANRSALPSEGYALATVGRAATKGQFAVTVAVVRPATSTSPGPPEEPSRSLTLRLPPGFRLASVRWVNDVLYVNRAPAFALTVGGTTSVLAGQNPSGLPAAAVTRDAQLLALDRSIPLGHARVLGLQYVSVAFPSRTGTTLMARIGIAGLTQITALELRFPTGMNVTKVTGPTGTEGILLGTAVQLVASGRAFREGLPYTFTLQLSRPPAKGDIVTLRASEHYFEGSLPFSERFLLT
jgi:hypothetical protein